MELRINIIRLAIFAILVITILIGVFVLKHQNKVIRQLNEVLRQEQVDDSIQRTTDSITYKQLQLRVFSDSMALAKFYRESSLIDLKEEYGDFGSGEMEDETTLAFLRKYRNNFPSIIRIDIAQELIDK
jgi:hypothetical protein